MKESHSCSESEAKAWFITLITYASLFALSAILGFYLTHRYRKYNPNLPCRETVTRILLSGSIAIKSILLFIQACMYNGLNLGRWETLVITLAGYMVNIAYLSILYSWCEIFMSVVGGDMLKLFRYLKNIIVGVGTFSLIQYFVTFTLEADTTRVVFSIILDTIVVILFISMNLLMHYKLEIPWSCSCGSENVVMVLCTLCSAALIIRTISFIIYAVWYSNKSEEIKKRSSCDIKQLVNYIVKELFGQFLPLIAVLLSDLGSSAEDRSDYLSNTML